MTRYQLAAGRPRHLRGWLRQPTDKRDRLYMFARPMVSHLPPSASIPVTPPVRDQGQIGSCTANAGCAAAGFLRMRSGEPDPMFSRLHLYAMTRILEGVPLYEDSGCYVRDVFKAMRKYGVCYEHSWPYMEQRYNAHPSPLAMSEALDHQAILYLACDTLMAVKHSIHDGYPVIGGFDCYSPMFNKAVEQTGVIPVPKDGDSLNGGHCVMFVAYDDNARLLKFQNSWGISWGAGGFGFLPYDYIEGGMAADFWTLRTQEM